MKKSETLALARASVGIAHGDESVERLRGASLKGKGEKEPAD